jgi:CRISPR-associated protein Cas1
LKKLLNVLYVATEESYLSRQGDTICVRVGGKEKVRVPSHTIESIICFGNTSVSTPLLELCGEKGIGLSFFGAYGKFYGRLEGPVRGNVLLRTRQYSVANDAHKASEIAYSFLLAKIANSRNVIIRHIRDNPEDDDVSEIKAAAVDLANVVKHLKPTISLEKLRGFEGKAANSYFSVIDHLIKIDKENFFFATRSRRPPLDNMNAIMSFLYMLLTHDARSALEGVGLDPAVGYLHAMRPGRPSLALDLMEELRAPLCDRLAFSLVNLKQLQAKDFKQGPNGVTLTENARKTVLAAWQKRKKEEIIHPYLKEKIPIGLILHLQAQLLARYLRGDLDAYPPFYWR